VTGQGGHDMGSGAISVRRTDEGASWDQQALVPASRYILGMRVDATSYLRFPSFPRKETH
jgi:hypothetical protein